MKKFPLLIVLATCVSLSLTACVGDEVAKTDTSVAPKAADAKPVVMAQAAPDAEKKTDSAPEPDCN